MKAISTLFAAIAFAAGPIATQIATAQTAPTQPFSSAGSESIAPQSPAIVPAQLPLQSPVEQPQRPTAPTNRTLPAAQSAPTEATLQCPNGYFASAFSDVTPDHWAYEAVNRLASVEPRCFPNPPRS